MTIDEAISYLDTMANYTSSAAEIPLYREISVAVRKIVQERDRLIENHIEIMTDPSRNHETFRYIRRPNSGGWDEYDNHEDAVAAVRKYHGLDPWDGTPHLGRRG
jgi:hypothetical protein